MDTAAVVIPIPVQPIEPVPQPPGGNAPAPDGGTDPASGFAMALQQQYAHAVIAPGAVPAPLPAADATEPQVDEDLAADAPASPDALIALLAAPPYAQQPAPAGPRTEQPALVPHPAAPQAGGRVATATAGDAGAGREAAPRRAEPLPLAATDAPRAAEAPESSTPPAASAHAAPEFAAAAALMQPTEAPRAGHVLPPPADPRAQPAIPARVGTPEWNDGLAQQVTLMVRDGEQIARLRLDPPELGPLEVRLSISRGDDAVAQVQFVSAHAPVRDALEAALPQLRAALAESGITLGQASVGEGYARDGGRTSPGPGAGAGRPGEEAPTAAAVAHPMASRGLVDTFA